MKKFLLNIVLILLASVLTYSQEVGDTLWTYNFNKEWSHINSALFSPDGQCIYANADYQGNLFTYKFSLEGKIIEKINNLKSGIHQFSNDGKFFWTDSLDKYDAITFKKVDSLKNHNLKSKIYKWVINEELNIGLIVHGFEVHSSKDKHFEIFDPKTMTVTQLIQNPDSTARMWDIDISSDDKYIALSIDKAVADGVNERVVSNRVEVWDAKELKPIKVLIENKLSILNQLYFSHNSKYLGVFSQPFITIFNSSFEKISNFDYTGSIPNGFKFSNDNINIFISESFLRFKKIDIISSKCTKIWN